ncbi:hypothetical protein [Planotetraspora kaengkrachanensis]|nr:hypothetical protein [Planotetraspora kaengkrachanensis]
MSGYTHAPVWAVLVCAVVAIIGFFNHTRFIRAGAHSFWAERYFNKNLPKEIRNMPFAQLPGAIAMTLATVMLCYTWISGNEVLDLLVAPVAIGMFVFLGVAVKRTYWPPQKAKPQWLCDEEERLSERK